MARVAAETGVATQMGNQGRSSEGHRQTVEWIRDGAIGAVREVHAWSGTTRSLGLRPRGPTAAGAARRGARLGPVARPARAAALPPRLRAVHVARLLGLRRRRAARHGVPPHRPRLQRARPRHAGDGGGDRGRRSTRTLCPRGVLVELALRRRDGAGTADGPLVRRRPDAADAARHRPRRPEAAARRGRERHPVRRRAGPHHLRGLVRDAAPAARSSCTATTSARRRRCPRVEGHHADWLQACKGGTPACSNFGYGARLTEFVLLGNVALRTGKLLRWDGRRHEGDERAGGGRVPRGTYRAGWELPA